MRKRLFKNKTVVDEHTVLLLHFDNNLTDSSNNNYTVSSSSTVTYETGKFGNSIKFGSSYLTLPSLKTVLLSDFTIDFWVKPNTGSGERVDVYLAGNTSSDSYCLLRFEIYEDSLRCLSTNSGYPWSIAKQWSVTNSGWFHIALVRYSNVLYVYKDGTLVDSFSFTYTTIPLTYTYYNLGGSYVYKKSINNIDEFRVSNIARWTSNFTPPTY